MKSAIRSAGTNPDCVSIITALIASNQVTALEQPMLEAANHITPSSNSTLVPADDAVHPHLIETAVGMINNAAPHVMRHWNTRLVKPQSGIWEEGVVEYHYRKTLEDLKESLSAYCTQIILAVAVLDIEITDIGDAFVTHLKTLLSPQYLNGLIDANSKDASPALTECIDWAWKIMYPTVARAATGTSGISDDHFVRQVDMAKVKEQIMKANEAKSKRLLGKFTDLSDALNTLLADDAACRMEAQKLMEAINLIKLNKLPSNVQLSPEGQRLVEQIRENPGSGFLRADSRRWSGQSDEEKLYVILLKTKDSRVYRGLTSSLAKQLNTLTDEEANESVTASRIVFARDLLQAFRKIVADQRAASNNSDSALALLDRVESYLKSLGNPLFHRIVFS